MIEYRGLRKLNNLEIKEVKTVCESEFKKIKRELRSKTPDMVIDVHKQEKEGQRAKYSFHIRVLNPKIILTAKHADFQILKALHRAFDNIKIETAHKFKRERTPKKIKKF